MKCLRCGTELKDTTVFCPQCSKVTSVPLPASPYLNKKIVIPKRTPAQSIKKQEPKKNTKKPRRPGPWILVSFLLMIVCAALATQAFLSYREKERLQGELLRLQSVEDECVRLTDLLQQSQQEVLSLEEEISALAPDSYLEERRKLQEARDTIDTLTADLARAKENVQALEEQIELLREKTEFFDAYIVFLQDDDPEVFHSFSCEKFTRHGYRAYNKQQALSLGYRPCPDCQ